MSERQTIKEIRVLQRGLFELRLDLNLIRMYRLAVKAGFKPGQPRNPKRSEGAGRWRRDGSPTVLGKGPRLSRNPRMPVKTGRLRPPAGIGHNGPPRTSVPVVPPPLEAAPNLPEERPNTSRQRTRIAKKVASWILKAVARRALGPLGLLLDLVEVVQWIQEYKPSIQSYFDEPMTLEELQSYADEPMQGYEIHHIVERTSAARDGFSRSDIDGYDNLIRVPTYKHNEITSWYSRPGHEFGGLSPREYLKGKSWSDRVSLGLDALKRHGVMK